MKFCSKSREIRFNYENAEAGDSLNQKKSLDVGGMTVQGHGKLTKKAIFLSVFVYCSYR